MKPAPAGGRGHLVAGEHGGDEREDSEHDEDDPRRMELGDREAGGGDVDHGVEGGHQLNGGVGRPGLLGGLHGAGPDLGLKLLGMVVFRHGLTEVGEHGVGADARIEVLFEQGAEGIPILGAKEVETQIGCSNIIGFLDDQVPAAVKALGGTKKRKANEKAEKRKDRGINDADEFLVGAAADPLVPAPDPVTDFHGQKESQGHAQKDGEGEKGGTVRVEEGDGEHCWKV